MPEPEVLGAEGRSGVGRESADGGRDEVALRLGVEGYRVTPVEGRWERGQPRLRVREEGSPKDGSPQLSRCLALQVLLQLPPLQTQEEGTQEGPQAQKVHIMKVKDVEENKGYGFVAYKTKDFASKVTEDLSNAEFKCRT